MASSCRLGGDRFEWRFFSNRSCVLGLAVSVALAAGRAFGAAPDTAKSDAERLVASAVQAEISGDITRSFSLLHDAVRIDPDNRLARWQLGEVQLDNKWVSAEEAQRRASVDPRQTEYRERRIACGESPQGQLALAKWCRKNDLKDEAQFHWASVLTVDPTNEEALHALNLRWQKGRLMSLGQVAQHKDQLQESKRAAEKWDAKLVKWRRGVSGHDAAAHDAALSEIRSIAEANAISSLEQVTLGRDAHDARHADECQQIGLAFVKALEKIPGQAATESLARHAVFAPDDAVRIAAVEGLKPRDQHDYVPILLGGLGMPIESSFSVRTNADGSVYYSHSLYREGPVSDWSYDSRRSAVQNDLGGRHYIYHTDTKTTEIGPPTGKMPTELAKKARIAAGNQNRFGYAATVTESRIANANQGIESLNSRIIPVLAYATGKDDLGDSPKAWWDWWRDQNEYAASEDHPVDQHYNYRTDSYYSGYPSYEVRTPPPAPGMHSCFAKGTPVWTKTGLKKIETLALGDLVLAQDVNTGELKYEPVIGRTVRPPSEILKISTSGEEIQATKGHPFWVTGVGWRMAKELTAGAMLHGVNKSADIRSVDSAGEAEAYNLVVADFNTYFVGEHGFLVHDNTPRRPTRAMVPGVVATK